MKCVMCGRFAITRDPDQNEPLCENCNQINEQIRLEKNKDDKEI